MSQRVSWLNRALALAASAHARRQLARFRASLGDARRVQERVLLRLIQRHAASDFGRQHGFKHIRRVEDFTAQVPVRDHAGLAPYLDQVRAGRTTALFAPGERIRMFAMTSGSTASPKYIPVTDEFIRQYRRGWNIFGVKALLDHPGAMLRPLLQVSSPMDVDRTPGGVPCGSISGLLAATQKRLVRRFYAVPSSLSRIQDTAARYYAIMRLAIPKDVAFMVTASPATQLQLARVAARHAESMIRDIRDGTLTLPGDLDRTLAQGWAGRLAPDPATAGRLAAIREHDGTLLPRRYWNLRFLANWTGGTLALHLGDFPACFGDVPVRDIGLLATEGRVTIGMEDGVAGGVLDVEGAYFEFVPCGGGTGDVRSCHELVPGETYRVVMTNSAGLYRYDIGDHVRVIGYLCQAPMLEFLHRGSRTASVTGEKITEWQVTRAFQEACEASSQPVGSFVLAPRWADPPFYRLYLQDSDTGGLAHESSVMIARHMDKSLSRLNTEYDSKRRSGRLGAIDVSVLPPKFLDDRDELRRRGLGSAGEQFKPQFLLTQPGDDRDYPVLRREPAPLTDGGKQPFMSSAEALGTT